MTAFGIDLSLRSTGIASFDGETWDTATIKSKPEDQSPGSFLARVDDIAARIIGWCDPHQGDVIVMEGLAFNAKGSRVDRLHYAWWAVFRAITEHHGEPYVIPPQVVKQIATGKGNASKEQVVIAMVPRLPDGLITGNDTADACALAIAAAHLGGATPIPLPKTHLTGLTRMLGGHMKGMP